MLVTKLLREKLIYKIYIIIVFSNLKNLPFYRAMGFTLAFTFVVTPLVILFGFVVALDLVPGIY